MAKERVERDEEDLVRLYLTDIGQYPLLTKDDEVRLAQEIEGGNAAREGLLAGGKELAAAKKRELRRTARHGDEAQRTFVQSNLRLVVSIAKKYQASGLPLLDLIQEGNLGLMHAVEKFDWRKGFRFSTYATLWIRQSIQRGLDNSSRQIRLPAHVATKARKVGRVRGELAVKLEREPEPAEIAEAAGVSIEEVEELRAVDYTLPSLDQPVGDDDGATLGDLQAGTTESPEDEVHREMVVEKVGAALQQLPEVERKIIELRFGTTGEPRSRAQVGRELKISPRKAEELEQAALGRLARMGELAGLAEAA